MNIETIIFLILHLTIALVYFGFSIWYYKEINKIYLKYKNSK